jgi:DNA-directed RNA polymerase specialized sigma24 family protein
MDRRTLLAALDGDPDASHAIARYLKDTLRPFLRRYFHRVEVSELLQSTLREMIEKIDEAPDDPQLFARWTFGFARTRALQMAGEPLREQARERKLAQYGPDPQTSFRSMMDYALAREKRVWIMRLCMLQLPDIYREAAEHSLDGGDHESLAKAAGISIVGARVRLWKAKRLLAKHVERVRRTRPDMRTHPPQPAHESSH